MKLLNKIIDTKPQPFRIPNRYEWFVILVVFVVMCSVIPKAQEEQRQKVQKELQKFEMKTQWEFIDFEDYPTINPSFAKESNIIESEPEKEIGTEIDPEQMMVTTLVNVRKQPDINSEVVEKCDWGTVVEVTRLCGDWSYVGEGKWIHSDYLEPYIPSEYIDIGLENKYQDLVRECISTFGLDIDEYFVYGLMYVESRFNPNETSNAEACGLMQVIPSTWRSTKASLFENYPEIANKYVIDDAFDTSSNIVVGIYCIKTIQDELGVNSVKENSSRILTCYNRGSANAKDYYNNYGTYSTSYSKNVLRAADFIRTNKYWEEGI